MKYTIGEKEFYKKQHIINYVYKVLESLPENKSIDLDSTTGKFASALIMLHTKYDGFLDYAKYVKLTVIKDEQVLNGYCNYKTFNFFFIDNNDSELSWPLQINQIIRKL